MSINGWKAQAKLVYPDGRLTTEGLAGLSPSRETLQSLPSATVITADSQVQLILPAAQSVTHKRNGVSVVMTTANIILNPGDILTLSVAAATVAIPL